MIRVFRSNRIYKSDLNEDVNQFLIDLLLDFNSLKRSCYNFLVVKERNNLIYDKSDYFIIKDRFPYINVYLRNSAMQQAKGLYDSNMELLKLHIEDTKEQIKRVQDKLNKEKDKKEMYQKLKNSLKEGNPSNLPHVRFLPNGIVEVKYGEGFKKSKYFKCIYDFETIWLKQKQKQLKSRVGQLTFKLNKLKNKLSKLTADNYVPASTFGGKKLIQQSFIKQGMTKKERQACRSKAQKVKYLRNKSLIVDGVGQIPTGNKMIRYDINSNELNIISDKQVYTIENVYFPYGQKEINFFYERQGKLKGELKGGIPITFEIVDNGDWYTVNCMLDSYKVHQKYDLPEETKVKNYSKSAGVIAVDLNTGFFSVCNLNERGQPLSFKDITYDFKGKTSNQVKYNIEQAVKELVDLAVSEHKPIVMEELKIKGKSKLKNYGDNKQKNFCWSSFAYQKATLALKSRCERFGVELFKVNPAYTSFIAREKYQPKLHKSVHQLASLTIGRRSLNCKEKIPLQLRETFKFNSNKTYINQWADLYKFKKKSKTKTKKTNN